MYFKIFVSIFFSKIASKKSFRKNKDFTSNFPKNQKKSFDELCHQGNYDDDFEKISHASLRK